MGMMLAFGPALAVAALPFTALALDVPARKPGYWELTTVAPMLGTKTTQVCITADNRISTPKDSGDCSEPKITAAGNETIVDVVCTGKEGKQTISTVLSGDFDKRYKAIIKMTFDPPLGGTARWASPSTARFSVPTARNRARAGRACLILPL